MCGPIIAAVVAIAAAVVQHAAQAQQAKREYAAIKAGYEHEIATNEETRKQQNQASSERLLDIQRQQTRELAATRAASSESGLGGITMAGILNDTFTQAGFESAREMRNNKNAQDQLTRQAEGSRIKAQGMSNNVKRPSYLATGLQIVGALAQSTPAARQG